MGQGKKKRNPLMEPTTIVERFGDWARDNDIERFWGISKNPADGRLTVDLDPNPAFDVKAQLITEPGSDDVYLLVGYPLDDHEHEETRVGSLQDTPAAILDNSTTWMLDLAREYKSLELGNMCVKIAEIVQFVAEKTGDVAKAAEAVILAADAND